MQAYAYHLPKDEVVSETAVFQAQQQVEYGPEKNEVAGALRPVPVGSMAKNVGQATVLAYLMQVIYLVCPGRACPESMPEHNQDKGQHKQLLGSKSPETGQATLVKPRTQVT